jgi:pimeloyl-ACP methyl ester carboxylesterase
MSYLNGSMERSTHTGSFSGDETRGQLDFVTNFAPLGRPDVLARGMLGMIAYDATNVLERINVPTLVFVGDQDTTTKPEAGEFIARNVPRAELVTLSPARHMGLIEHHERFDRHLAEFAAACQVSLIAG